MCPLESGGNQSLVSTCCQKHWNQNAFFSPARDSVLVFGGNKLVKLDFKTLNWSLLSLSTFVSHNDTGLGKEGKKCAGSGLLRPSV